MKLHSKDLLVRMIRTALKSSCRYRVVAAGFDRRGRIITIKVNTVRLATRGWHAEERVIRSSPRSLARIVIARVSASGDLLPIDPCQTCARLADKLNISIERI